MFLPPSKGWPLRTKSRLGGGPLGAEASAGVRNTEVAVSEVPAVSAGRRLEADETTAFLPGAEKASCSQNYNPSLGQATTTTRRAGLGCSPGWQGCTSCPVMPTFRPRSPCCGLPLRILSTLRPRATCPVSCHQSWRACFESCFPLPAPSHEAGRNGGPRLRGPGLCCSLSPALRPGPLPSGGGWAGRQEAPGSFLKGSDPYRALSSSLLSKTLETPSLPTVKGGGLAFLQGDQPCFSLPLSQLSPGGIIPAAESAHPILGGGWC